MTQWVGARRPHIAIGTTRPDVEDILPLLTVSTGSFTSVSVPGDGGYAGLVLESSFIILCTTATSSWPLNGAVAAAAGSFS